MKHLFTIKFCALLLVVASCTSCTVVGTLYPVYDNEKNYVMKAELIGNWQDPGDKKGKITISADEIPKQYRIAVINFDDDNNTSDTLIFNGHLEYNYGTYYLEYWYQLNNDYKDLAVVRHFIAKINFAGKDKLEANFVDGEKLIKLIDQKKLQLTYAKQKTGEQSFNYLILDKSSVLQKAISDLKKYPEVFSDKTTLVRAE